MYIYIYTYMYMYTYMYIDLFIYIHTHKNYVSSWQELRLNITRSLSHFRSGSNIAGFLFCVSDQLRSICFSNLRCTSVL